MTKIKPRTPIPTKTSWNGHIATFKTFKQMVESWAFKNWMQYLMSEDFMSAYIEGEWFCARNHLHENDEIFFKGQFYHDHELLYRALMYSCRDISSAKYVSQQ